MMFPPVIPELWHYFRKNVGRHDGRGRFTIIIAENGGAQTPTLIAGRASHVPGTIQVAYLLLSERAGPETGTAISAPPGPYHQGA